MCPNCRAFITSDDRICPYCQAQVGERIIDRRAPSDALGGLIPHQRFVTMLILLINTGLYVATMLRTQQQGGGGFGDLDLQTLKDFGAKFGPFIYRGEWWRLITAGFLHGGLLHILMNSWVLFDLGPQVNQAFGTPRFLSIYFVSSVTGYLASLYWSPSVSIGASAGLCGLIGAMIALGTRDRSAVGAAMRRQYIQWMVYLLIFGLLPGLNIDNAAHIGGLAGGFVVAYLAGTPGFSGAVENFWRVAAGLSLAITGWAFFEMFMHLTSTTT